LVLADRQFFLAWIKSWNAK